MATYCFCGCGRKVRFANKRLSRKGADAAWIVETLETAVDSYKNDAKKRASVEHLIVTGRNIRDMYRDLIHGTAPAPPVSVQGEIAQWEGIAGRLAEKHHQEAVAFTRDSLGGLDTLLALGGRTREEHLEGLKREMAEPPTEDERG